MPVITQKKLAGNIRRVEGDLIDPLAVETFPNAQYVLIYRRNAGAARVEAAELDDLIKALSAALVDLRRI